jgi:hypothetical protein
MEGEMGMTMENYIWRSKFQLASMIIVILLGAFPGLAKAATSEEVRTIRVARKGMIDVVSYMPTRPDIFPPGRLADKRLLSRDQRQIALQTWQAFLDRVLVLDALGVKHSKAYGTASGAAKKEPFFLFYAAFLAQYRYAMDFINLAENNPALHIVLNEPVPEIGLPENTYADLKFRFLNVLRGAEFVRLDLLYTYYRDSNKDMLAEEISDDSQAIWQAGHGKGPHMTLKNALQIVQDTGLTTWFPVQKQVSEMMGDTKVWRPGKTLISKEQIREMEKELEPGDVLLERREWYMSNIGMPGYWPHVALYIGTPEKRKEYFSGAEVRAWLKALGQEDGSIEGYLQATYPDAYRLSVAQQGDGELVRVIEAKGEGVIFTSLEYSAGADSVAAIRPVLSKIAKARAVIRAFHYSGRPYDFNFDFLTDAELVCTELVYKAYESSKDIKGLHLPVARIVGREVTPANYFAKLFDEEYGTDNRQFDFVLFYDADERAQKAFGADIDVFRESWKRPKWHILVKDTGHGGS